MSAADLAWRAAHDAARPVPDIDLDLFAGPGGWDEGVKALGVHPVGFEWDDAACRTGKAAGHTRVRVDVAAACTEPMRGRVRGLIASPPCQTFSMAGKGKGRDALPELQDAVEKVWRGASPAEVCPADLDVKSVLVLEPVRYARDLRPEWICLEQVPAVLPIWQAFAVVLRHHGYSAWVGVLNSADYGVPQTRQRAILIASRIRKVAPPPPTHTKGGEEADLFGDQLEPWVSMASALGWAAGAPVAALRNGNQPNAAIREADEPASTVAFGHNASSVEWVLRNGNQANACERAPEEPAGTLFFGGRMNDVRWVVRTGNNSMVTGRTGSRAGDGDVEPYERSVDLPAPTVDCGAGSKWSVAPKRLEPGQEWALERPATTVVGSFSPDVIAAPGYRLQTSRQNAEGSVRVTVQEAAVLQSFPPDYPWQGSRTKQFEQVGNAVPPRLAMHVLAAVLGVEVPAHDVLDPDCRERLTGERESEHAVCRICQPAAKQAAA